MKLDRWEYPNEYSSILTDVNRIELNLINMLRDFALQFSFISNTWAIGSIAAFDLDLELTLIQQIFKIGIQNGIYLRPIGNTLYIMPPIYNLPQDPSEIKDKLWLCFQQLQP